MRCGTRPGQPFQVDTVIKKGGWRVTAGGPPRLCVASTASTFPSTLFPIPPPISFTKTATYCNIILYHCVNTCGMPSKNTPLTTYRYIGSIVLFQQVEGASIACWFFSLLPLCFPFHSWFAPRLLSYLQNAPTPSYLRNTTECIQICSCAEVEWIVYFNLIVALVGVTGRGNGKSERREFQDGKRQLCIAAVTSFLLSVIRDSDGLCFKHTHTRPQSLSITYFGHPPRRTSMATSGSVEVV